MSTKTDTMKNCITEAQRVEAAASSLLDRLATLADTMENISMKVGVATEKLNTRVSTQTTKAPS